MRAKDITGQQFGRLTALYPTGERRNGYLVWRCRCIEGNEIETTVNQLTTGGTQSCGCLKREQSARRAADRNYRHGGAIRNNIASLYICWHAMKQRCFNPNDPAFKYYGGRGIIHHGSTTIQRSVNTSTSILALGRPPNTPSIAETTTATMSPAI